MFRPSSVIIEHFLGMICVIVYYADGVIGRNKTEFPRPPPPNSMMPLRCNLFVHICIYELIECSFD